MGFARAALQALVFAAALPMGALAPAVAQGEIEPLYIPAMVVSEANFRADPSTGKPPLDTFQAGKQVLITGLTQDDKARDWYEVVVYDDGREGFIFGNLLRPLPSFASVPEGLGATMVNDAAERDRLIGRHDFSIAQMVGAKPGELVVYEDLGLLYVEGAQQGEGQRLTLNGWVTEVRANRFTLRGSLAYVLPSLAQGECRMSGEMAFSRPAKGTAWRLEATKSPCGQWNHTVDIQLRKE